MKMNFKIINGNWDDEIFELLSVTTDLKGVMWDEGTKEKVGGIIVLKKDCEIIEDETGEQLKKILENVDKFAEKQNQLKTQVGGNHYKKYAIQPTEYCQKNKLNHCESSIVKYATRWQDKGGLQDLEKIKHYVDLLIEIEGLR